jgi:hypothetical protein
VGRLRLRWVGPFVGAKTGRFDGRLDGLSDGLLDGLLDGTLDGRLDGFVVGWMDGRLEGRDDGRRDGTALGFEDGLVDGPLDGIELGRVDGADVREGRLTGSSRTDGAVGGLGCGLNKKKSPLTVPPTGIMVGAAVVVGEAPPALSVSCNDLLVSFPNNCSLCINCAGSGDVVSVAA